MHNGWPQRLVLRWNQQLRRLDRVSDNVPLITMFDKKEGNNCFSFFELGLRGVLCCDLFAALRCKECERLSLCWPALF